MEQRDCPHGWSDCSHCLYEQPCTLGIYEPEEDDAEQRQAVVEAAAAAAETVHHETLKSIKRITQSSEPEEFWQRWAETSPKDPQNTQRDVIVPMPGAIKPGGSKLKRKKSAKGNMVFTTDWDGL